MAHAGIRVGTEAANVLLTKYRDFYHIAAQEQQIVTLNFSEGGVGSKMGRILAIDKISRKTSQETTPATDQLDSAALTYNTDTETRVTATARRIYSGVELPRDTINGLVNAEAFQAGYVRAMTEALAAAIDVAGATLANALTTNQLGGAGQHITASLLGQSLGAILVSAKNKARAGKPKYLCYHSAEHQYVLASTELTAADIRGDEENPVVGGFVSKAYGLILNHSGNVYQSGGLSYNLLHIPEAFVLAYNVMPSPLDPQPDGLVTRLLVTAEFGVAEVEDAEAAVIQTAA